MEHVNTSEEIQAAERAAGNWGLYRPTTTSGGNCNLQQAIRETLEWKYPGAEGIAEAVRELADSVKCKECKECGRDE